MHNEKTQSYTCYSFGPFQLIERYKKKWNDIHHIMGDIFSILPNPQIDLISLCIFSVNLRIAVIKMFPRLSTFKYL